MSPLLSHVDQVSRVVCDSAHAFIPTNRRSSSDYQFLSGENFAGSHHLADAMSKAFASDKVRVPRDVVYDQILDSLDEIVYNRHKLECKKCTCMYEAFAAPCRSFSRADRNCSRDVCFLSFPAYYC